MLENLLGFAFSLFWAALAAYFYKPNKNFLPITVGLALLCVGSLFLPEPWRTYFWLPGSTSVVVLTAILALGAFSPGVPLQKMISLEIPSSLQLRDTLLRAGDQDKKQAIYIKLVNDYAKLWRHRETLLGRMQSIQLLIIFAGVHLVNFLYLATDFVFRPVLSKQIKEILPEIKKAFPNINNSKVDITEVFKKSFMEYALGYSFFQNALTILITLFVMRFIIRRRNGAALPLGSLNLFSMPEKFIFIFIASLALPILSFYVNVPSIPYLIFTNIAIFLLILYIFSGMGIFNIFLEVRLLPSNWIFLGILLISSFFPIAFIIFLGIMAMLGLGDFFFNFRKRALHPVTPSI